MRTFTGGASHTGKTAFEEVALGVVRRELDGVLVGRGRLAIAAEAVQQGSARRMKQMHAGERRLEHVDQRKPGVGAFGHRDGDGAVERDDR